MPDFFIKEGDRSPSLTATLVDENEEVIPLDAATEVKFYMTLPPGDTIKVDGVAAEILAPAANGRVAYHWAVGNTDTPGDYDGEFKVLWSDGKETKFPNFRYLSIRVMKSIQTTD